MKTPNTLQSLKKQLSKVTAETETASAIYLANVQRLVDLHGVELATGQMSDTWQIKTKDGYWLSEWDAPKTYPFFAKLRKLDESAQEFGIGPSNLERFKPNAA